MDGTAYSVTGTTNRHGEANKAYAFFDGTTRVVFPESIINGLSEFTYVMWMKYPKAVTTSLDNCYFHGSKIGGNDIFVSFIFVIFNEVNYPISYLKNNIVAN